jgi:NAD-dependent dihydropyrimidine dehydrogenase PreA subunit
MVNVATLREKIPWFPTIDPDLCIGDQDCVEFCKNNVLAFDENTFKVLVVNPYNCVVGCSSCATICPQEAIHFPSQADLRNTLRKLHSESSGSAPSTITALDATAHEGIQGK